MKILFWNLMLDRRVDGKNHLSRSFRKAKQTGILFRNTEKRHPENENSGTEFVWELLSELSHRHNGSAFLIEKGPKGQGLQLIYF